MKKITEPSVEIIRLPEEDIITTSNGAAHTNTATIYYNSVSGTDENGDPNF